MVKSKSPSDVRSSFQDDKGWEDEVELFVFRDGQSELIRLVGNVVVLARHWIKTIKGKVFPMWCPKFDSETEGFVPTLPCPQHDDFGKNAIKVIVGQGIIRRFQERGDENPIRCFQFPYTVNKDFQNVMDRLKCSLSDIEKGCDLSVLYDSSLKGSAKWSVQRDERTPLSKEEQKYRLYDLESIIPDFTDPVVSAEQARKMKEAMARNYWYVLPKDDAANQKGFYRFKWSVDGAPYTDYPELVEIRDGAAAAGATGATQTQSRDDDDDTAAIDAIDKELSPKKANAAAVAKKPAPVADESAPAPAPARPQPVQAVADDDDDVDVPAPAAPAPKAAKPAPVPAKAATPAKPAPALAEEAPTGDIPKAFAKQAAWVERFAITFKEDGNPVCHSQYDGSKKCQPCIVKASCIDAVDE